MYILLLLLTLSLLTSSFHLPRTFQRKTYLQSTKIKGLSKVEVSHSPTHDQQGGF